MGRWTIVNGLLALILALLGFEIAGTWARGLPPVAAPASAAVPVPEPHEKGKRAAEKAAGRAQQTPAALVAAITEKDLFDPSRRAPTPEEVKTEVQAPVTKPPDGVTVVGVRMFGKDREVFVTDATQNPATGRRLRAGDQIAGYTVKTIEATAVTLVSPSGDPVVVPLTLDKGGKPGAPGVPPRAPVPGRPPQVAGAPASPAAGSQGASPAAGVPVPTARPPAPAVVPPPAQPPGVVAGQAQQQQLPADVRQKLQQLRQNDKRAGRKR